MKRSVLRSTYLIRPVSFLALLGDVMVLDVPTLPAASQAFAHIVCESAGDEIDTMGGLVLVVVKAFSALKAFTRPYP
jgi:hypothetical protein